MVIITVIPTFKLLNDQHIKALHVMIEIDIKKWVSIFYY
jgi:hypothetical protein